VRTGHLAIFVRSDKEVRSALISSAGSVLASGSFGSPIVTLHSITCRKAQLTDVNAIQALKLQSTLLYEDRSQKFICFRQSIALEVLAQRERLAYSKTVYWKLRWRCLKSNRLGDISERNSVMIPFVLARTNKAVRLWILWLLNRVLCAVRNSTNLLPEYIHENPWYFFRLKKARRWVVLRIFFLNVFFICYSLIIKR